MTCLDEEHEEKYVRERRSVGSLIKQLKKTHVILHVSIRNSHDDDALHEHMKMKTSTRVFLPSFLSSFIHSTCVRHGYIYFLYIT